MDPSILSDFSASFGPIRQVRHSTAAAGSAARPHAAARAQPVIERINELLAELETLSSAISDMALEHIHAE